MALQPASGVVPERWQVNFAACEGSLFPKGHAQSHGERSGVGVRQCGPSCGEAASTRRGLGKSYPSNSPRFHSRVDADG